MRNYLAFHDEWLLAEAYFVADPRPPRVIGLWSFVAHQRLNHLLAKSIKVPIATKRSILSHTVGKLLDGKTPKQAKRIKIVDPTCGSGSFLLGAYGFLLEWHRHWYEGQGPERYKGQMYRADNGEWRLTVAERKDTVLNQVDARKARELYLDRGLTEVVNLGKGIFGPKVLNTSAILISGPFDAGKKVRLQDLSELSASDKGIALARDSRTLSFDPWKRLVQQDPHSTYFVGNLTLPTLLLRLRKKCPSLRDVLIGDIQRGLTPDVAEAHVLEHKDAKALALEKDLLRPSLSGGQIKRFSAWRADRVLIYTTRDTDISRYPNIRAYMMKFKASITCPEVADKKHPWWALHRPRDPEIFEAPKLIGLTTATTIELVFDARKSLYVTDAMYVFRPLAEVDPISLMAVMQSSIFHALYSISNQGEGRVIPQVKATKLHEIPVPEALTTNGMKRELNKIVQTLEALNGLLKRENVAARKESYQRQIFNATQRLDDMVAEMYGLSTTDRQRLAEYLNSRN